MKTYTFQELDAYSKSKAINYHLQETNPNPIYEKNWVKFFSGMIFYVDGTRAPGMDRSLTKEMNHS